MRFTFTAMLLLTVLAGCQQVVEIRTQKGMMELIEYRSVIHRVDKQLSESGLTVGAKLAENRDRITYLYAPAARISAGELKQHALEVLQAAQVNHPFVIESVEIVSARSRGVRVKR